MLITPYRLYKECCGALEEEPKFKSKDVKGGVLFDAPIILPIFIVKSQVSQQKKRIIDVYFKLIHSLGHGQTVWLSEQFHFSRCNRYPTLQVNNALLITSVMMMQLDDVKDNDKLVLNIISKLMKSTDGVRR